MKKLIKIPGDGNCLFNAILVGYVDAHNGQYPTINGVEIRTQDELRRLVQQYYQERIDASDQDFIQCLREMLIDIIKFKNFSGLGRAKILKKKLESISSKFSLPQNQDREGFDDTEVNLELIQLYVDSITSIWGSGQEILTLRDLLGTNIRISGHGNPQENEIELNYEGGNHYNVYVSYPYNGEVSNLINSTKGTQISKDNPLLTKDQVLRISTLKDYEFHLFLQIIYNKREAEQRDVDSSITDEEVSYAIACIKDIKKKSTAVEIDDSSEGSFFDTDQEKISPLKPKKLSSLFGFQNKKPSATTSTLSNGEKYDRYYDDTSSEEGDREEIENSRIINLKKKAEKLKEKIRTLKEVEADDHALELSFLAHEFGIRVLASPQVYKRYLPLKDKYLASNTVLTDEQITKFVKSGFKKAIKKTYTNYTKILDQNQEIINTLITKFLEDKRTFIKAVREKNVVKKFSDIKKSLELPSETKVHSDDELAELVIEIHKEIGEELYPKPGDIKSAYLKCDNKNSRTKLQNYKSESPLKMKLAEKLRSTSTRTIKTFLKSIPEDIKEEKIKLTDIFISNFESELLTAVDEFSKDKVYRKTLPSHFDISFNHEEYDVTQFLAYIRLLKVSNTRLIKNYRDNSNILDDDIETLSRSFSLLGLESRGIESQEISKKTGTRRDIVGIGKADGSTSYAAIAKILNNKSSNLDITDADIAKWIVDVLEGNGNELINNLEITHFQKEMLEKFINSLTYLMFSTEVARNPASLIINYMILELISEEYLSWKEVFEDRQMPMSIADAVKTSRWMHANYDTTIRYSYDKTTSNLSNDNSENDMNILEDMINKEAEIFKEWLSLNGIEYDDENSFSKAISLLTQKCSQWYGVTVVSKSLIIDLLADLLEEEIADIKDAFDEIEGNGLENLLKIASDEDTKEVLSWCFEENIHYVQSDILEQIANLGSSELEELESMIVSDYWEERKLIFKLLDRGLELSKCIAILKNAISNLNHSDTYFDLNDITRLDSDQLEQLYKLIFQDKSFLSNLNYDIKIEELLDIYSDYSDDQEKLDAFLDKEFLSLRSEYKQVTNSSISLKEFYILYNGNENKLRFLLDKEYKFRLINRIGYDTVSEAFDQVCKDEGIEQENLFDADEQDTDIYQLIYDKLITYEIINSNSDEEVSVNFYFVKYDNEILNNSKAQELFELAAKSKNLKAMNFLLDLWKDQFFAEQIILLIDELGVQKVWEILFEDVDGSPKQIDNQEREFDILTQTQEQQTLDAMTKIEAIIGKDALNLINGFYQSLSSAIPNGTYIESTFMVIDVVSNLIQNLQYMLDLSSFYESVDLDNKVSIILAQLDNIFCFLETGSTQLGFVYRRPHFYPFDGDDDNDGFSGGGYSIKNNDNDTYLEVINMPVYLGANSSFPDI